MLQCNEIIIWILPCLLCESLTTSCTRISLGVTTVGHPLVFVERVLREELEDKQHGCFKIRLFPDNIVAFIVYSYFSIHIVVILKG